MGKKNKLHLRRDQALQKQQTLYQRQILLNQISQTQINQEIQRNMVTHQASKTKQQNREMVLFKQKMNIQLDQKEQKLIDVKKQKQIQEESNDLSSNTQPEQNTPVQCNEQPDSEKIIASQQQKPRNADDVVYTYDYDVGSENDDQLYLIENFLEIDMSSIDEQESNLEIKQSIIQNFDKKIGNLPINEVKLDILHEIRVSDVFCINAATGSGKSTQVPQFFLCDGISNDLPFYQGKIIMSEPRRVAVIGLSERIRQELNTQNSEQLHGLIGHAVRGYSLHQEQCKLNVVTEGVLLQMLLNDKYLNDHSVVILDEAHERSQDFDLILGCLARAVKMRRKLFNDKLKHILTTVQYNDLLSYYKRYMDILYNKQQNNQEAIQRVKISYQQYKQINVLPLKLVIMSATIGRELSEGGSHIFQKMPKTISQNSKTFPVAIHYELRPQNDYINAAFKKIQQIHSSCMAGNILVFLTGKSELNSLFTMLQMYFQNNDQKNRNNSALESNHIKNPNEHESNMSFELSDFSGIEEMQQQTDVNQQINQDVTEEPQYTFDQLHVVTTNGSGAIVSQEDIELLRQEYTQMFGEFQDQAITLERKKRDQAPKNILTPIVLQLHSQLPLHEQQLIYQPLDPKTHRLIILATNIAESSVTVPDVRYVIDACRHKQRISNAGGTRLAIQWCTEANLAQRSGRTGRTCPGHCFRLITPGQVSRLEKFPTPDIASLPIENAVIKIVRLGFNNVRAFPFLTYPGEKRLKSTLELLHGLNIIVKHAQNNIEVNLSQFGAIVSYIPLDFKPAHIIAQAFLLLSFQQQHKVDNQNCDDFEKIIKLTSNLPKNSKAFLINTIFFAISITDEDVFEQGTLKWPIQTQYGDIIDQFFTFGAFMAYSNNHKKQIKFCKDNGLRFAVFQDASKVLRLLCQKWKLQIDQAFFQVRPTHDTIQTLLQMYLRSNLANLGFLECQNSDIKMNDYIIPPVNIYDYLTQEELESKLTKKQLTTQLISKAKINRSSYYQSQIPPQIISFRECDVVLQELKTPREMEGEEPETYQIRVYLKGICKISLDCLVDLAEFSPFLVLSDPISFYQKNGEIVAKCTATYDNFYIQKEIGEIECEFPGKNYFQQMLYGRYNLLNQILIKLIIILLLQKHKQQFGPYYISSVGQILKLINENGEVQYSRKYIDKLNISQLIEFILQQDQAFQRQRITTNDIKTIFKFQAFRVKSMLADIFTNNQQFEQFWQCVIAWCK